MLAGALLRFLHKSKEGAVRVLVLPEGCQVILFGCLLGPEHLVNSFLKVLPEKVHHGFLDLVDGVLTPEEADARKYLGLALDRCPEHDYHFRNVHRRLFSEVK